MILTFPTFYRDFKCIANRCTDSCCIGWEIDIDSATYDKYRLMPESFQKNIAVCDGVAHFVLTQDERCPFLQKDGLCKIILEHSEDMLCDICREHPRFYEWYGEYKDAGVGLCCEEAVRLLLESEKPLEYESVETQEISDDDTPEDICKSVFELRKSLFSIINDRSLTLSDRIERCFLKIGAKDVIAPCSADELFAECVEIAKEMSPFDELWEKYILRLEALDFQEVKERINKALSENQIRYEKSLSYFVFRHFIKACFDGDLLSHFKFAVIMTIFEMLIDCVNGDLFFNTRYLSKQVEYSEENIDALTDECCFNALISENNILAFLNKLFNGG